LQKDDRAIFAELDTPLRNEIRFSTGQDMEVFLQMCNFLTERIHGHVDSLVRTDQESAWQRLLSDKWRSNGGEASASSI
jgi:hypothetical protein